MFFLIESYFSANEHVSLTAHDIYHADAESLGHVLTGGGLVWALLGFCGMKSREKPACLPEEIHHRLDLVNSLCSRDQLADLEQMAPPPPDIVFRSAVDSCRHRHGTSLP